MMEKGWDFLKSMRRGKGWSKCSYCRREARFDLLWLFACENCLADPKILSRIFRRDNSHLECICSLCEEKIGESFFVVFLAPIRSPHLCCHRDCFLRCMEEMGKDSLAVLMEIDR